MEWAPKLLKMEGEEMKVAAFSHSDGASYIAWLFQGVAWQFGGKYSDPDFTMHMTDEKIGAINLYGYRGTPTSGHVLLRMYRLTSSTV